MPKVRPKNPDGYCLCGCGRKTAISDRTDPRKSYIKGEPKYFVHGHGNKSRHRQIPKPLSQTKREELMAIYDEKVKR